MRRFTRLGLGLSGSLIGEVRRRDPAGSRRTPDHLLVEDASGMPGPALVGPVADFDAVLLPDELDPTQAKELALAAGQVALQGAARRLRAVAAALPGALRDRPRSPAGRDRPGTPAEEGGGDPTSPAEPAERAAWERFVTALEEVTKLQAFRTLDPDEAGAEHLRWAEVELEDAVAVAGEFEVHKIRWLLA